MCGLSGFFGSEKLDLSTYYKAHTLLRHRGPDDEGFLVNQAGKLQLSYGENTIPSKRDGLAITQLIPTDLCLGFHRLKILDMTAGGHQPFRSSCGRYFMIFNGEIYNYLELKDELIGLGHKFTTTSDTEVFLTAFAEWQEECFNKLNGMWAAVIFDTFEQQIYLTRDRFGIKPLYVYAHNKSVYFASELRFFKAMGLPTDLNDEVATAYLRYSITDYDGDTFFRGIQHVPPSHYLVYARDGKLIRQAGFWQLGDSANSDLTYSKAVEKLRELFHSSLKLRMRSDVPVGALLSGGLDSTSIVCSLDKYFNVSNNQLESFSAVFNEVEFSERAYVEETAKKCTNLNPHYVTPNPEELQKDFTKLVDAVEIPFRSLAVYSQYKLYEYIKSKTQIVVLLNGQGADELFAGYGEHYFLYFAELLKKGKIKTLFSEMKYAKTYRENEFVPYFKDLTKFFVPDSLKKIMRKYQKQIFTEPYTDVSSLFKNIRDLRSGLAFGLTSSALPEYLHYEDSNSMRFSKETRLPFLDYRIVEFAFSLPSEFKIENGINKSILRAAVKRDIPASILNRKDKMGFVSPQSVWQKTTMKKWMADVVLSSDSSGIMSQKAVEKLYNKYLISENQKLSPEIWRIFCFKYWHRQNQTKSYG